MYDAFRKNSKLGQIVQSYKCKFDDSQNIGVWILVFGFFKRVGIVEYFYVCNYHFVIFKCPLTCPMTCFQIVVSNHPSVLCRMTCFRIVFLNKYNHRWHSNFILLQLPVFFSSLSVLFRLFVIVYATLYINKCITCCSNVFTNDRKDAFCGIVTNVVLKQSVIISNNPCFEQIYEWFDWGALNVIISWNKYPYAFRKTYIVAFLIIKFIYRYHHLFLCQVKVNKGVIIDRVEWNWSLRLSLIVHNVATFISVLTFVFLTTFFVMFWY